MNLVVFGFNDWDTWASGGFCTRCARLVRDLSARQEIDRVLLISTPKSVLKSLWRRVSGRSRPGGRVLSHGLWFSLQQVDSKVFVLDHFRVFPKEDTRRSLFRLNRFIHDEWLRRKIRRVAKSLGLGEFILWVANPLMVEHVGRLQEKVSVFDAIDDWRLHPQKVALRKELSHSYRRVSQEVDIIFTVSEALREDLSKGRSDVFWLPNGVDAKFFSAPRDFPVEFTDLSRPILVYIGILQERMDIGLLTRLAAEIPHVSVALVGGMISAKHFAPVRGLGNIHFLGYRQPEEVAAFIQHADVCIMPHVADSFTKSMNPLKLYEYLAAGKPVVATRVPGLEEFEDVVQFADDADSFISLTKETLRAEGENLAAESLSFAEHRDWSTRVDFILDVLDRSLDVDRGSGRPKAKAKYAS